jgi:hypothetical protein
MTSSRLGQQLTLDFSASPAATPQAEGPLVPSTALARVPHSTKGDAAAPRTETPPEPKPVSQISAASAAAVETEPPRNQHNYRITEADRLGSGSLKTKCLANLEALELLKRIEADDRRPTPSEKRTLVRYVGWGGLPQIFDSWNEEWTPQRERLEHLLTPEELESARATTLNAHYTAPSVVSAMYDALRRLGFSHPEHHGHSQTPRRHKGPGRSAV